MKVWQPVSARYGSVRLTEVWLNRMVIITKFKLFRHHDGERRALLSRALEFEVAIQEAVDNRTCPCMIQFRTEWSVVQADSTAGCRTDYVD